MRYPNIGYQVACSSIVANINAAEVPHTQQAPPHLLRWTLTLIVSLLPSDITALNPEMSITTVLELLESATLIILGSKPMQKVAHQLRLQQRLT